MLRRNAYPCIADQQQDISLLLLQSQRDFPAFWRVGQCVVY